MRRPSGASPRGALTVYQQWNKDARLILERLARRPMNAEDLADDLAVRMGGKARVRRVIRTLRAKDFVEETSPPFGKMLIISVTQEGRDFLAGKEKSDD